MTTGSQIEEELSESDSTADVDKIIWSHVKAGHVPDYIAEEYWKEVIIEENGHKLKLLVAPDYFAVGTDNDPFRVGRETPMLAQKIADHYDSILPSTKIVRKIQEQASPKWGYTDVKGPPYNLPLAKIETHQALVAANNMANKLFEKVGIEPGEEDDTQLGYRKAIVVGPDLDGSRVAIYGGRWSAAGDIVQPYSTIHEAEYGDYSHGIILVSRKAELDGEWVDLRDDVFGDKDPSIHGLVVDLKVAPGVAKAQKRFDPVFPNAGKGSLARFSVGPTTSDSSSSSSSSSSSNVSTETEKPQEESKAKKYLIAGGVTVVAVVAWLLS